MKSSLCILIPCLNEELGVGGVVTEFRREFPGARILVVDNGSTDKTTERAREAGAEVVTEPRRGKALAVCTGLGRIDEDLVVMVDGDGSYGADAARLLYEAYETSPTDMVTGTRQAPRDTFRPLHQLGGAAFSLALRLAFGYEAKDVFSGLRLFSKRFYKNVPILFRGFELETELTIQAVDKSFTMREIPIPFRSRAVGSESKLRTVADGFRILRLLVVLFRDYKPLVFFSIVSACFACTGIAAGFLPVWEYFHTRMVGRFPLAILAAALMNLAVFSALTGLVLESALRHRREAYQVELRKFRG
ncbi:MAG: glycosyltransferase [Holophagales bacterium]|nr:glycosyltransferase [Holophagales bacterium]